MLHSVINHSFRNNYFLLDKRISLMSCVPIGRTFSPIATRAFSTTAIRRAEDFNPESLALEHINSGKPTNASVINKILLNQDITITDSKLKELLKVEGVELNLYTSSFPLVQEDYKLFSELTGKSSYKGYFGVYMFIHKITGKKYVGSSNLLRRRMDYYFKGDFPLMGKFLPLLSKEGLGAFKLIIFKLDKNKFKVKDALILEQYHLLNKEFDLNTLKVVNTGSSKGESVYVYDLTCSTLYYHASSKIELKRVLKVHPETCKKYLDSNLPYLNRFLLLSGLISTAVKSNMSIPYLLDIMQKERQKTYTLGTRRNIPVILEIKDGNTYVDSWGQTLKFDSLTTCINYLRDLGLIIKRETLSKYIKIEKEFYKFLCKYSYNSKPDNFEEVGLIIDEYKKLWKEDLAVIPKVNQKNKPILVKGPADFSKEFETITDTIKYFESINIKLNRKYLYVQLKNGKPYKGYYFYYL
uniref:GIY endonuclease n=3 Tax=Ceratocystis TaxID=5157 RepID=A0A5C1VBK9_9PEZI|nr:GIY endonuclease [Ceratocystis cacaofunesta]YP_009704189.1 GIY endonuclease [Ceratocystis fimbriata]YP_009710341.1 GIY endonuclease [Ceratocystis albifundus]AFO38106.1 GIY endonuclease [Ceratocystis cacaofunesta]QEN73752.1 GIY endonuclease [Ceratocystis fimbriata]QFX74843.1 GIY endonuclease [Ceratocystis albifundus]